MYNLKAAVSRLRKGSLNCGSTYRDIFHISSLKRHVVQKVVKVPAPSLATNNRRITLDRCSLFLKEVYLCFFRNFASPSDFKFAETPVQQQTCKIRLTRSLYIHVSAGFWSHDQPNERGLCSKLQLQSIAVVQNMEQVEMCSSVFIQGDESSSMVEKVVEDYVVVWFAPQLNFEYGTALNRTQNGGHRMNLIPRASHFSHP